MNATRPMMMNISRKIKTAKHGKPGNVSAKLHFNSDT